MTDKDIKRLYMDDETKKEFEKCWGLSFRRKEDREVKVLRNAIAATEPMKDATGVIKTECAVFDEGGTFVKGSGMFGFDTDEKYMPEQDIEFIDKEAIFAGRIILHYGHFLLSSTIRLYHYIKNRSDNPYIVWTIGRGEKLPKYAADFFELLNIPSDRIILIEKDTRFKSLTVPPPSSEEIFSHGISSQNYCYFTDDFVLPFKEAAKNVAPAKYKKVYWTRRYWTNTAQCLGESDIERVFVKNGFKSVAPENLSLREQIAVIKGADIIAGIHGTSFHNALFSDKPGLKLIIFCRNEEYDFQYIVNEAVQADWYAIKVYASPFPVSFSNGPFIMGMTPYLKEFLQNHGLKDFNVKLDIDKHLKDFCLIYANIYSNPYYQEILIETNRTAFDSSDVFRALRVSNYSLAFRIFYYIAYHMTFGALKIKYKNRHRALKNFASLKLKQPQ